MTFEEELKRIDADIKKLKIQFDLYFTGANPKPPTDQRDALDKLLKKHQNTAKTVGERFLYNAIVNKFNAFSELWSKSLRVKEEGARVHPLALRAAHQGAQKELGGAAGPPAAAPGGRGSGRGAARRAPHENDRSWRIPTAQRDEASLRALYESFIAAKNRSGDERKPTFDAFSREIARHTATLRGKVDCEAIDFTIYCKDNKVGIKGKPSR